MIIQGVSYLSDFEAKKAMAAAAAKLYARGWMIAGDGSLSVRVGPNAIWISTAGADKSNLTQDKMVRIDINGRQTATNKPKPLGDDIETQLRIYKENDRVRSIIHAYPVSCVALSAKGKGAEASCYTPALRTLGRISLVDALKTEQVISDVTLLAKNDNGVIINGDGCMMWGETPQEAADYVELLDYYCETVKVLNGGCNCGGQGGCHKDAATQSNANATVGFIPAGGVCLPQGFTPKCTADCSVCANTTCTQRRTAAISCDGNCDKCLNTACTHRKATACTLDCSKCGNMTCTERRAKSISCSGNCDNCLSTVCTHRRKSTCTDDCLKCDNISCNERKAIYSARKKSCDNNCSKCMDITCTHRQGEIGREEEVNSKLLPSGMTGIVRPGEPLPPLPDEQLSTMSTTNVADMDVAKIMATGDKASFSHAAGGSSPYLRASGTINAGLPDTYSQVSHASTEAKTKEADKRRLMQEVAKHMISG